MVGGMDGWMDGEVKRSRRPSRRNQEEKRGGRRYISRRAQLTPVAKSLVGVSLFSIFHFIHFFSLWKIYIYIFFCMGDFFSFFYFDFLFSREKASTCS